MASFSPQSRAQATVAPLFLYTNGSGSISPLSGGQMLTVGQVYDLQANPDPGFLFGSWQPVNVFTITEITLNSDGTTNAPLYPWLASPVPDYTLQPALQFTMQAESLILDSTRRQDGHHGQRLAGQFRPGPRAVKPRVDSMRTCCNRIYWTPASLARRGRVGVSAYDTLRTVGCFSLRPSKTSCFSRRTSSRWADMTIEAMEKPPIWRH